MDDEPNIFEQMIEPKSANEGYSPIPTKAIDPAEGSLAMAALRNFTDYGYFMNSTSAEVMGKDKDVDFDWASHVPDDLIGYADRFATTHNEEQVDALAQKIRVELNDKQLIAEHPYKSLALGMAGGLISPTTWLVPGNVLYRGVKNEIGVAKTMAGVGIGAAASTGIQEALLQTSQETRELQESITNTLAAGVVGAALGGLGFKAAQIYKLNNATKIAQQEQLFKEYKSAVDNATKEVNEVYNEKPKDLTADGLLKNQDIARMPKIIQKTMKISPMNRMLTSKFNTAKLFANDFYERSLSTKQHELGETTGIALETKIASTRQAMSSRLAEYQDIYFKSIGIESGPFKKTRANLSGSISYDDFDRAVHSVIVTGKQHPNEAVNRGAKHLMDKVFNPLKDELIELNILPEDITVKNAVNYITIVFNKQKIIEQGGKGNPEERTPLFNTLYQGFERNNELAENYKASLEYKLMANEIEELKVKLKDKKLLAKDKPELKKQIKELEARIIKEAPYGSVDSKGKLRGRLSPDVLASRVEQSIDTILGHDEGALFSPVLNRFNGENAKPLNQRVLDLPQKDLAEWHLTSASTLANSYVNAVNPVIQFGRMASKYGAKDLTELKNVFAKSIKQEYDQLNKGLKGKEAAKLKKEFDDTVKDINDSFDIMLGVYSNPKSSMAKNYHKLSKYILTWNAMRMLGYMTLSSFADVGNQAFKNGLYASIHEGIIPMAKGLKEVGKQDLAAIGYGIENVLSTRMKSLLDYKGLSTQQSVFSRAFDSASQGFGNATLINYWNNIQHRIAGTVAINRLLSTIHKAARKEKLTKKEIEYTALHGLDKKHWDTIYKFTQDGYDNEAKVYRANWTDWDIRNSKDAAALRDFQSAVSSAINSVVIVPRKGDLPTMAHTPLGKFFLQFKTFFLSSTNRITYSAIQNRHDMETYTGLVSMLALGGLSYLTKSYFKGKEPDLSFQNMAIESVDNSGALGIFMEVFNVFRKTIFDGGPSRYRTRDLGGAWLGPTGGTITELKTIFDKLKDASTGGPSLTTKDAEKLVRLFPYQNLFYLDKIFKKVTREAAIGLGATEVPE